MYFYYPYNNPQVGPTVVQAVFPIAVGLIIIVLFLFAFVALKSFRNQRVKRQLTVTAGIFAVLCVAGSGVLLYFANSNIPSWFYDSAPYLTWSNNQNATTGITVNWHSAWSSGSTVHYGLARDNLNFTATSGDFGQFHHVRIDGLQQNTTYYYKIDSTSAKLQQFKTAPVGNATFTFTIWSDPRENNPYDTAITGPNMPLLMDEQTRAAGKDREFSICCGDIADRGVARDTWKLWLDDIGTNDFAANYSNAVAFGNHERHDDANGRNLAEFYNYDPTTYSFTYGQLHCIMIDPWNVSKPYWSYISNSTYTWIKNDLAAHATSTFTVIAIHPPPVFSDGTIANDPNDTGGSGAIGTQIVALASMYHITAVFSGHDHTFWKYYLNKTMYYTIGMGGVAGSGFAGNGYCRVDVSPTMMAVNVIRADTGTLFDQDIFVA